LALSNLVVIGDGIHFETHLLFLLFIYSVLGFGILFHLYTREVEFPIPAFLVRYKSAWIATAIAAYFLTIVLGLHAYQLQKAYTTDFRNLSYQTGDYSSLVYGSYYIQMAAQLFLAPAVLFGVVALPVAGIFYGKYKFLLLGLILAAAADMQVAGRASLYCFALAAVLAFAFVKRTRLSLSITLFGFMVVSGVLIVDTTKRRLGSEEFSRKLWNRR
jgi:hypothetical protein